MLRNNLRERLQRIQNIQKDERKTPVSRVITADAAFFTGRGWVSAGHLTLRREVAGATIRLPAAMPSAAGIVMPGLDAAVKYEDLLFFDLETTGLSGGAGTVAFLAAFGRLKKTKNGGGRSLYSLGITQYLLLDYPGEYDFIEAVLSELKSRPFIMASYNGKSFDSQILKTRCLMNGLVPPEYRHADLVHPARRLWKRLLPDCSQGTIEAHILGIDRAGDTPGAMAPDIWFDFLKTGDAAPLMGICEHNRRDIAGLAAIFGAMAAIAADPAAAMDAVKFDEETLALRWYDVTRRLAGRGDGAETGLLRIAAEKGGSRAQLLLGQHLLKAKKYAQGRDWLEKATVGRLASERRLASYGRLADAGPATGVQSAAFRALAIDSEWRLRDAAGACALAEKGLKLLPPESPLRADFERRIERLRSR